MKLVAILAIAGLMFIPGATAKEDNPPCNGIWYNEYDVANVATVGTNLQTDCTFVDVYLPPVEQCIREGDYHPVRTIGPVTVWEYRCG